MSKFIRNQNAIMGLTLSSLGLIIASAILLAAVFSFIFLNDWQTKGEIDIISSSFTSKIEVVDTLFYENTTTFYFPDKKFEYNVLLSSEYITINAGGTQNDNIFIRERFVIRPWIRTNVDTWKTSEELHEYLKTNFENSGNLSDPIQKKDPVNTYLDDEWVDVNTFLSTKSYQVQPKKPVFIEKTILNYQNGEKLELILLYQ